MLVKFLWRTTAILGLGCSSTPVDVGSYIGDAEERWGWTDEKSCAAGPQLPIVGTWIGFTDRPRSASRSAAVRLVIAHANGRRVCGTLTIGAAAPPWPPVTDAEAAYPPELVDTRLPSFGNYLSLLEGVPMTITGARVGLPRLLFRASYAQWKDWCSMQTPYRCEDIATEEYYCIPVSGSGGLAPRVTYVKGVGCVTVQGGEPVVVDCGKVPLCLGGPCKCDAAGCIAPPLWGEDYDLEFNGDTAAGSGMFLTRMSGP